jgi:hypothetical protein
LVAIKELEASLTPADNTSEAGSVVEDIHHLRSCPHTVRALCEFRQGNVRIARQSLSTARVSLQELERARNYPSTNDQPSDKNWALWIFEKALLHEAEQVVEGVDQTESL